MARMKLRKGPAKAAAREPEVPADDPALREALQQMMAQHYHGWLDQPLPALGGRTPRAAAKDAPEQVRRLLWQLEEPGPGGVAYDTGWMYRELGLARAGEGEFEPGYGTD